MITTTQTLISLACLLANKGEINTNALENQLSGDEKILIAQVINSKACLPENLEILLKESKKSGGNDKSPAPSEACFAKAQK